MTNLEALQAMLEYKNDNLLAKALTDRAVAGTGTYSLSSQQGVELAAADIYLVLLNHPTFKEGTKYIAYSAGALLSLRNEILKKYGKLTSTIGVPMDSRNQKSW